MNTPTPIPTPWRRILFSVAMFLLVGLAPQLRAAIAFDSVSSSSHPSGSVTSLSWSHTLGSSSDRVVVVGLSLEDTNTADLAATVKFNGVTMTPVSNQITVGSSTFLRTQLYYLLNSSLPASGTYTVSVTFGGSVNGVTAGAISLSGVAQAAPEATATNSSTSASSLSTNINVLTAGAWVVDAVASGASTVTLSSSASGMTQRYSLQGYGAGGAGATKSTSATGATTMSWSASTSSQMAHSLAAFAPSGTTTTSYTLTTATSGSGSITRSPNASTYTAGTVVSLTATPASGYTFSGWSGDLTGTTNPASITMNANKSVTATFTSTTTTNYTLSTSVTGSGSISLSPSGGTYASGTVVTVTATAGSGATFSGWSGDLSGSTNPTTITMNANKSIGATFTTTTTSGDLYVSPSGSASAAGTISAPTTLESALTRIAAGNTIWMRGGTYTYSATITIAFGNNGTSSAPKKIYAYSGETPVLNFAAQATSTTNRGLQLYGNYWYLKGLVVERAGDNGIFIGGNNNTLELCLTRFNRDSGVQISRRSSSLTSISDWPSNNLVLNCTSHDNSDATSENADGFACKLTSGPGNVFRGCIAHHNSDDGWDLYTNTDTGAIGPVLIENCIAYNNGTLSDGTTSSNGDKNGFKLGGSGVAVQHTIRRSLAFNNGHHGFTDNNNPGPITVTNNTAFNNTNSGFNFRSGGNSVFTNNASLNAGSSDTTFSTLTGTTNLFWKNGASDNNGGTKVISASDFISLTVPSGGFTRNSDGSIALGNFAKLASGSDLVNGGTPSGTDIGAVESW
jgi:uncharacterized repeat protein (TIGR02543 family)